MNWNSYSFQDILSFDGEPFNYNALEKLWRRKTMQAQGGRRRRIYKRHSCPPGPGFGVPEVGMKFYHYYFSSILPRLSWTHPGHKHTHIPRMPHRRVVSPVTHWVAWVTLNSFLIFPDCCLLHGDNNSGWIIGKLKWLNHKCIYNRKSVVHLFTQDILTKQLLCANWQSWNICIGRK